MSATTPRYDITYPTGSDLVSQGPAQFKQLAESVESALGEVDDRQTDEAVKPVVRTTLAQLAEAAGITGQSGYVTDDGDNTGFYVHDETSWTAIATHAYKWVSFTPPYSQNPINILKIGRLAFSSGSWTCKTNFFNKSDELSNVKVPEELIPLESATITANGNNNQIFSYRIDEDGMVHTTGSANTGYLFMLNGAWVTKE